MTAHPTPTPTAVVSYSAVLEKEIHQEHLEKGVLGHFSSSMNSEQKRQGGHIITEPAPLPLRKEYQMKQFLPF